MKKSIVEIAMASDAGYAVGMYVTAASIALYASRDVCLSFTFLDGGIPNQQFDSFIEKLKELHPSVTYRRIKVEESDFKDFTAWRGNKMTYSRFMLIKELSDVDFVVYCDVDFLWLRDISKLWEKRDENVVLQAVRDPNVVNTKEPQWFKDHGYEFNEHTYLCAGFLFMNLKMLRAERFDEQAYALIRKHPDFLFADQESFVILLGERTKFLDDSWMRFSKTLESSDFNKPIVCHFVNDVPWKSATLSNRLRDATMAWKLMADKIAVLKLTAKERVFYFLTRAPVLRHLLYGALYCMGKRNLVQHLRMKCAYRIRFPNLNKNNH